jgi:tRNA threonylcarbamoyladenosine modification (KEOPS) complex  Pcc1 subunit
MKARCSIEVRFPDGKSADAAMKAISHEGDVGSRSGTKISREGGILRMDVDAEDIVAMRAALNAYLRALQAFEAMDD